MDDLIKVGDFPIGQDLPFERRWWAFQRISWALLAVTLGAGLLGIWGRGCVSHARTTAGDLELEHDRVRRLLCPVEALARFGDPREGRVSIAVSASYLQCTEIERVEPQPIEQRVELGRVVYVWPAQAPGTVRFIMRAKGVGVCSGQFTLDDGPPVAISQLTLP